MGISKGYLILNCLLTGCLCLKEVFGISRYYDHLLSFVLLVSPVVIFQTILWKSIFTLDHILHRFTVEGLLSPLSMEDYFRVAVAFVVLVKGALMNFYSLNICQTTILFIQISILMIVRYYYCLLLWTASKLDYCSILENLIFLSILSLCVSWDSCYLNFSQYPPFWIIIFFN